MVSGLMPLVVVVCVFLCGFSVELKSPPFCFANRLRSHLRSVLQAAIRCCGTNQLLRTKKLWACTLSKCMVEYRARHTPVPVSRLYLLTQ